MILSGLLYSSWPLGYWLNPRATYGLASDLGALYQPYNWLFISLDVGCAILVIISSIKLFAIIITNYHQQNLFRLQIAVMGVGGFGLFTGITALMPLNCIQGSPNCQILLSNPYFLIHGIFSIGSVTFLTISIIAIWLLLFLRDRSVSPLAYLLPGIFLLIWLGFGIRTLSLVLQNRSSTLSQRIFIEFCSLWLVLLPYLVGLVIRLQPSRTKKI